MDTVTIIPKSDVDPVLLNCCEGNRFIFQCANVEPMGVGITSLNAISQPRDLIQILSHRGTRFLFNGIESEILKHNLMMVDSCLDRFMGECLLVHLSSRVDSIVDIVDLIRRVNPFSIAEEYRDAFYKTKMMQLITHLAFGMNVETPWVGELHSPCRFLTIKRGDEIVSRDLYYYKEIAQYLYANSYFASNSTNQCIFKGKDGLLYLKLNLQIRFK